MIVQPEIRPAIREHRGFDTAAFLSIYGFLLFTVPSSLVYKPLGATATPASLFALVGTVWWALSRLRYVGPRRPIGFAGKLGLIFMGAVAVSFVAAMTRVIDTTESNGATNALVAMISWIGLMLIASDSHMSPERLTILLHRLTLFGSIMSAVGLLQFLTGQLLVDRISIPGLTWNSVVTLTERNGFTRPSGTATHPLEFGIAICMLLPVAVHVAFDAPSALPRWRRFLPVVMLGAAAPLSLSRSAMISFAVVLVFLFPTWGPRLRRFATAAVIGGLLAAYVAVPGFLGTLAGMVTGLGEDTSISSRTDSYAMAFQYWLRSPIVGRGFGTFDNSYRILDNQYLGLLIDTGVLGVAAVLCLMIGAVTRSLWVRRHTADARARSLAVTLAASISAGALSNAFYDGFAFPIFAGLLFLLIGLVDTNETTTHREDGGPDG